MLAQAASSALRWQPNRFRWLHNGVGSRRCVGYLAGIIAKPALRPAQGFLPCQPGRAFGLRADRAALSPSKNIKELLTFAKSNPGALTYASSGNLSAPHLAGALLSMLAGVPLIHVPYKDNGPASGLRSKGALSDSRDTLSRTHTVRESVDIERLLMRASYADACFTIPGDIALLRVRLQRRQQFFKVNRLH